MVELRRMKIPGLFSLAVLVAALNASCIAHRNSETRFPDEVCKAAALQVRKMAENAAYWEGLGEPVTHLASPEFAARCENGALSYCSTLGNEPCGGWIVKTEIDLVGDAEKEIVWQIIPPVVGSINYLNNVLVYSQSGIFLFHAPPQIIFSAKNGSGSRGSFAINTPTRYDFAITGADEWVVSPDGVTMLSYDVRDYMNSDTGEYTKPGLLHVTKRCFSKQGVQTSENSYAADSTDYAALRETLRGLCAGASAARIEGLNHVSSLVIATLEKRPAWLSGKASIDSLLKQWSIAYPAQLEQSKSYKPEHILNVLEK